MSAPRHWHSLAIRSPAPRALRSRRPLSRRPARTVVDPGGREWRVTVGLYRRPAPRVDDVETIPERMSTIPFWGPVILALSRLSDRFAAPVLEATVGRRAWIEASAEDPPVTMVWRATGRASVASAVDDVADALARGEERPAPLSVRWVGYDRGAVVLPPKD
jgi:hypothetical protein